MAADQVRKDDIGTVFEVTVNDDGAVADISSATTKEIIFIKGNGVKVAKTATFTSDGTDGKIRYTTVSGDLNIDGRWQIQGRIIMPAGTWSTSVESFTVHENL